MYTSDHIVYYTSTDYKPHYTKRQVVFQFLLCAQHKNQRFLEQQGGGKNPLDYFVRFFYLNFF